MKTNKIFSVISIFVCLLFFVTNLKGLDGLDGFIMCSPSNYTSKITLQNDMSAYTPWGSWKNVMSDAEDLGANTLVLTHTAFFDGTDPRGILQLVDIYVYNNYGDPLGGYNITVFGVNRRNGNIQYASTNIISATEMFPICFQPYKVGSRTVRVGNSRTIERCSSIVMSAKNIGSSPHVIFFYCTTDSQRAFDYPFSFNAGERKPIVMTVKEGNFQANRGTGRFNYFWIDRVFVTD